MDFGLAAFWSTFILMNSFGEKNLKKSLKKKKKKQKKKKRFEISFESDFYDFLKKCILRQT